MIEPKGSIEANASLSNRGTILWRRSVVDILLPMLLLAAVILSWHVIVVARNVPSYIVPTPGQVAHKLLNNRAVLVSDLMVTSIEAAGGFAMGSVIAIVSGMLIGSFRLLQRAAYPLLVASQAVPVVAIAPLIIVWFGNGILGKMIMAALICYFPVVVNTIAGVQAAPPIYQDLFRTMAASRVQTFWKLRVPFSLPHIFTGLRIGAGLSTIGAIVAELAGAQHGLGYRILIASYQLDTPLMFAAMLVASILGVVFFYVIALVGTLSTRWATL